MTTVVAALAVGCGAKTGLGLGPGPGIADAGTGGTGGAPAFDAGVQARADKIDLLFMIDGSGSMTDKQEILAVAVPDLVRRLNNPLCVASDGKPSPTQPASPVQPCPAGYQREFNSVQDMHIGVISSDTGPGEISCTVIGGSQSRSSWCARR